MSRPLRPPASTGRRCGTVTVAGQTLSVTQVGTNCSYQLQSPSTAFPPAGGTASLGVLTATGCMWTASSGSSWLHVARPAVKGETAFLLRGRRRIDEKRIFQSCPNRHSFGPLLPPGFKGSRRTTHSVILYRPTCRFLTSIFQAPAVPFYPWTTAPRSFSSACVSFLRPRLLGAVREC